MVVAVLVGSTLGFLSGLGTGGGSLLILWLTLILDHPQDQARAINLMFFIPSALIACLFRWKQQSLPLKKLAPAILGACVSAVVFSLLANMVKGLWLRKLFGILLLYTGVRELLYRPRKAR